jgi:penicillin-binding protein 1A
VLSAQNAWLMSDIMHDVTVRGTAVRATRELKRDDLAGKTGTSQEGRDNWFNGFNTQLVASVWVGFDDDKSLGEGEEGSRTALPIWIHYMREMLRSMPLARMERPGGLIDLRVSPTTGMLADPLDPDAMYETFMLQHQPRMAQPGDSMFAPGAGGASGTSGAGGAGEPLF